MAKKLSADLTATLKKLGIKAKTEEEAHDKLIAILEKNGIEGMEDESLTALIDMADAFLNDESEEEEDEEVESEEEEEDTVNEEVESEEEDDDESEEEMDELADEVEAEEAKKEEKKIEKKSDKRTTEKKQRKSSKNGVRINPKTNIEGRKVILSIFQEIFPEKDYEYNWIVGGVAIKHIGKNSKRVVLGIYDITLKDNDNANFTLVFNTMTKETEKLDELGLDYSINWAKQPFIRNVTPEYAKEVIGMLLETILGFISKVDKRLGENRKKMEENLKKTSKK